MSDIVRILRVIEYEGPREWIYEAIRCRGVKGEYHIDTFDKNGKVHAVIRETIIGETSPVVISQEVAPDA